MKGWTATVLLASGFSSVAAATERWLPACSPGQLRSVACTERQAHAYDFTAPSDPWLPIGHAAELEGLALLLAAVAIVTLTPLLVGVRRSLTVWLGGAAFAVAFGVVGTQTLLSGRSGSVVGVPGDGVALAAVSLLWPLALLGVLLSLPATGRASAGWRAVAVVLLLVATPTGAALVASAVVPATPYDTVPWTEAVAGGATMLAGLALLPVRLTHWTGAPTVATRPWPVGRTMPTSH